MNARDPWTARLHDSERLARGYRARAAAHDSSSPILERLQEPSFLVPVLVLLVTALFSWGPGLQFLFAIVAQHVWDAIVTVTPARLLFAVDGWLNPPLFTRNPSIKPAPMQAATHAAKSEALRRILGLDTGGPGGIMASVSQAGRRPKSSFALGKANCGRPAGLGNISNSCYQNSILQGLASLKSLPGYLGLPAAAAESQGGGAISAKTAGTLLELIADLNNASNNGNTLWTPAVLKNMSTWQQQDAQEYFSKLLDEVDNEIIKAARVLLKGNSLGLADAMEDGAVRSSSTLSSPVTIRTTSAAAATSPPSDDGFSTSLSSQHSDDSGYQSLPASRKPKKDAVWSQTSGGAAAALRNPLEGLTAQRVACVACGWSEGLSMIPFNCITLSLGMDRREHDLYERLDAYTRVERISGVECGKCTLLEAQRLLDLVKQRVGVDKAPPSIIERAAAIKQALEEDDFAEETISKRCQITKKISSTKTKQAVVARGPQSLVIHMNRSVFDENTGQMFKNLATVRFPMLLDLGPWCLGSAGKHTAARTAMSVGKTDEETEKIDRLSPSIDKENEKEEEQWLLDPTTSMVAGPNKSKIAGPIYELRAVVTHQGRHENGHYVCYRKHRRPGKPRSGSSGAEEAVPSNLTPDGHVLGDEKAAVSAEGDASVEEAKNRPCDKEILSGGHEAAVETEEEDDEQWWRLSDQNVSQVSEDVVLSQGGVFMLFYDCVDPVPILTSEAEDSPPPTIEKEEEGETTENAATVRDDPGATPPPPCQGLPREGHGDVENVLDGAQNVPLPPDE